MAALKRLLRLGIKSESCLAGLRTSSAYSTSSLPSSSIHRFGCRQCSPLVNSNGTRARLVDNLALVRRLEAQGVPSKQAEAITCAVNEALDDRLEHLTRSFVSKIEMQKTQILQESSLSKFKSEVMSLQEHRLSLLQHETKKLRDDIEKTRSELKWTLDELANRNAETTNLTNELNRKTDALRNLLVAYDVIKYCIGPFVFISVLRSLI